MLSSHDAYSVFTRAAVGMGFQSSYHPILTEKAVGIPTESPYPENCLLDSGRPKPPFVRKFRVRHVATSLFDLILYIYSTLQLP